ncbi:MAG: DDE-type integrase/transposase/recombinase [Akkermansia sp.]|nr:DDE-type integrase/transposase/recombinase [Akkermansia sp.]
MGYLHPNDVWSSDITVVKIKNKRYYICAVMDWASRKVLGWRIGPNMTTDLCLETLDITSAMNDCRQPHTPPLDAGIVWPLLSNPCFSFPYAQQPAPSVCCCLVRELPD